MFDKFCAHNYKKKKCFKVINGVTVPVWDMTTPPKKSTL